MVKLAVQQGAIKKAGRFLARLSQYASNLAINICSHRKPLPGASTAGFTTQEYSRWQKHFGAT
jgi:hypothetical protein